ncbi:putative DNA-binding pseudobarrel domain superfamily [Helianthus debilis subsp. tardiflorus]
MSFYKSVSSLTKEFLVIPPLFCKTWLSSAVDTKNVFIKCINGKIWLGDVARHNGTFAFMESWEKVVADLSLSKELCLYLGKLNHIRFC